MRRRRQQRQRARDAIATVNGTPITKANFTSLLTVACARYKAQGQPCPKVGTPTYSSLRDSAVTFLVQQQELQQEADKLGVSVTQKDIDKQVEQIKKTYYQGSEKKLDAALKKDDITLAQLEQYELRPNLLGQDLQNKVTANVKVSDAAAQKYYNANKSSFTTPKTREVRHILVNNKSLADTIETKLKNGASFAALAKQYSKDTGSAAHGGKLCVAHGGTSGACSQTVAPFDKAAFSLKTNEISQPVKSVYGYHIIQALGRGQARPHPDVRRGQGADPGEPRLAAEADGLAGLAREDGEGLQGQGRVPDGLHAGDDRDADDACADDDRLSGELRAGPAEGGKSRWAPAALPPALPALEALLDLQH